MFALRVTGRRKVLAYRHGYHGHGGYAALVTGSAPEGVTDHYSLPTSQSRFFGGLRFHRLGAGRAGSRLARPSSWSR